jgi:DNA repair exonuclease SbcCD ATPase subunit
MRIISLEAENFRILKAIELAPDAHMVTIGGRNGQGKSSVLDALWVALEGRAVAKSKPIRAGEEQCRIKLTLGDDEPELIITRTFKAKEAGGFTDSVKVESGDGRQRFNSPQAMLDGLIGAIGFDPLEFVQRKAEDQADALLGLVPLSIDLEAMAREDAADFADRTLINREAQALKARIEALVVPDDLPADAPDREALTNRLAEAGDHNSAIERERMMREQQRHGLTQESESIERLRERGLSLRDQIAELVRQAEAAEGAVKDREIALAAREKELAALPALAEPIDTAAVRAELAAAEAALAGIDRRNERAELLKEAEAKVAASEAKTKALADREQARRDALAKAPMPIEGLGFAINERGKPVVLMNGQPFDQASSAEQIKASTAIAMAANPELRVLRIKDGSLLDEDAMAAIAQMAEDEEFQLWVERVGTGGVGIVIENGAIKGAAEPEARNQDDSKAPAKKAPAKKKAESDKPEGGLI